MNSEFKPMDHVMNIRRIRFGADAIKTRTEELKAMLRVILDEIDDSNFSTIDEAEWMEIACTLEDIESCLGHMKDCFDESCPHGLESTNLK